MSRADVPVTSLAREVVADMYREAGQVSGAIVAGIRKGEGDVDTWFAVQAAQRAINAVREGRVAA